MLELAPSRAVDDSTRSHQEKLRLEIAGQTTSGGALITVDSTTWVDTAEADMIRNLVISDCILVCEFAVEFREI